MISPRYCETIRTRTTKREVSLMRLTKNKLSLILKNLRINIPADLQEELLAYYGGQGTDDQGHPVEYTEQDIYEQLRKKLRPYTRSTAWSPAKSGGTSCTIAFAPRCWRSARSHWIGCSTKSRPSATHEKPVPQAKGRDHVSGRKAARRMPEARRVEGPPAGLLARADQEVPRRNGLTPLRTASGAQI